MKFDEWKPNKKYVDLSIKSKRLVVRPFRQSDFESWKRAYLEQEPKKNRFDSDPLPRASLTPGAFKKRLKMYQQKSALLSMFKFGIFFRLSGELVGSLDLTIFDRKVRWANLGYHIQNQYWNQGFATEAAKLALQIGFGPLHLHRIEASCELENKASARVALKAGLVKEGVRKKFFSMNGGIDLLVFAQNAIDYRKKSK
jgi:ribosomal-protein-alanine N-acetyltransferase